MISNAPEDQVIRQKTFSGRRWTGWAIRERIVRFLCFCSALISVLATAGIIFILLKEAISFFRVVPLADFYLGPKWEPAGADKPLFGVLPLVTGTLLVTVGSGLVSIPLGVLVGIYLSEYSQPRIRKILKPALELLAGIPSVVYGYFALFLITPFIQALGKLIGWEVQAYNAASGAIVVGIMTLPLVASLCEDAISSVPRALREGAYGLGSTKTEVTTRIVLPAALSGIVASFILALSRAIGETMAVTIAAGATPNLTLNPGDQIQTMTAYIVLISKGDIERGSIQYQTIFAVGLTLFLMTLFMNLLAQRFVRKFRRTYA